MTMTVPKLKKKRRGVLLSKVDELFADKIGETKIMLFEKGRLINLIKKTASFVNLLNLQKKHNFILFSFL
jgi:hypothetical protein